MVVGNHLETAAFGRLEEKFQLSRTLSTFLESIILPIQKDYISEAEFRKNAEAGDILLFRGLKNSSIMQRVVTRDEFGISYLIKTILE